MIYRNVLFIVESLMYTAGQLFISLPWRSPILHGHLIMRAPLVKLHVSQSFYKLNSLTLSSMEPPKKAKRGPYGKRDLERSISAHDLQVDSSDEDTSLNDVQVKEYINLRDHKALCVESESFSRENKSLVY